MGKAAGDDLRPRPLTGRAPDPADRDDLGRLLGGRRLIHRLGQNFLVDPGVRDRIAQAAGVEAGDEVVEIGAGAGTLTVAIAPLCRRLVAIELDPRMASVLRRVVARFPNVEIIEADALRVNYSALFAAGGHVVVGNIPYYLTGALLPLLLEPEPRPRRLALVVQREVAERWTGDAGAGLSTLAVQVFAIPRLELVIAPEAFEPPPRVASALVVMDVRPEPAVSVPDLASFFDFAGRIFQHRRKQLGGALARALSVPPADADAMLGELGIDRIRRAETLSLREWESLYLAIAR